MTKPLKYQLPVPHRNVIARETLFLFLYTIVVLFIFQPFGTFEYAHTYKLFQLSGYCFIILFLYPVVKKGMLLFTNNPYDLKQEISLLATAFILLTLLAFFYHAFVIDLSFQWSHLPVFLFYGTGFWILPFCAMVYYKTTKTRTAEPVINAGDILEIKGTNLYEQFRFNASDIIYLKSNGNYVMIYFQKEDTIKHEMVRNTLNQVRDQLGDNGFTAIHRSFLVNARKFDRLIREDGKHLLISQKLGLRLPVSRNMTSAIGQKLKDHS